MTAPSRPRAAAETIKAWIVERGLAPGDRLPQERELIETLGVSKGTVREALRILEAQGLIRTRTGPGGGAFITDVGDELAGALLANRFVFGTISIADIYEMRIALEPRLAAELAARITPGEIATLRRCMSAYREPPASLEEEREQRIAELRFHRTLAGFSANPLLSFTCTFLVRLLEDLTVCRRIYERPARRLRERGLSYQEQLIDAFEARDEATAEAVMTAHMRAARQLMLAREAEVRRGFLPARGR